MNLLLDTTYVYALAGKVSDLRPTEAAVLSAPPGRVFVSAASIWEIRLKWNSVRANGARKGPMSPAQALSLLSLQAIDLIQVTGVHAATALDPPLAHSDPFDELLLAQAQVEGLKLFTRDAKLKAHPWAFSV